MSVLTAVPKFLFPTSRQFPFDEIAEKIVRAIAARNWNPCGFTVEYDSYGSGEAQYQLVRYIKNDHFKMYFCRPQGQIDSRHNNVAALSTVHIPGEEISVYEDYSGPSYVLYVGEDWEADREWFMTSSKVHSKRNGDPRRYLKYSGHHRYHPPRPIDWLKHDNDLNREYDPVGKEPHELYLPDVFKRIIKYLEDNVLAEILKYPEEGRSYSIPLPMPTLIPYAGPWPILHASFKDWNIADRIELGKTDPSQLKPEERHASFGSYPRLCPLDVRRDDRFPRLAQDGFLWMDPNQNLNEESVREDFNGYMWIWSDDYKYLAGITLKYANGVYVADHAAYTKTKKLICEAIPEGRDRLTDAEVGNCYAARGATIIPINDYKGDYEDPIVLMNRELDFDEVVYVVDISEREKKRESERAKAIMEKAMRKGDGFSDALTNALASFNTPPTE